MKHLHFMRHGLSMMNKEGVFSGRTETPLAPEGIAACHAAGKELAGTQIDVIVASPIRRAYDSARIMAEELGMNPEDIIVNELFVERDFGPLEGTPYSREANLDDTEGVEHSTALLARTTDAWTFLQSLEAENILVVSHGSVGRALRSIVQADTPFEGDHFDNAKVVELL